MAVTEDHEENEHRGDILFNLEDIVQSLGENLRPGQVKLTFGFDALDITMANNVTKLLLQLPIMKECTIRLGDKPTLNMRQLAERTATKMKGIDDSLSKKVTDPFPSGQLPKELRLMVLKHTDLVRSREHGFAVQDLQMWIPEKSLMPLQTCCHGCKNAGDICCCQRIHAAYSTTCKCPWPPICLLFMSKQMREEAIEVLLTSNCIHLRKPDKAFQFLRSLRPSDLRYIRCLEIDFYPRRIIAKGYFALRYHQLQWTTLSKFIVENFNLTKLFLRINSEENHLFLFTAQKSLRWLKQAFEHHRDIFLCLSRLEGLGSFQAHVRWFSFYERYFESLVMGPTYDSTMDRRHQKKAILFSIWSDGRFGPFVVPNDWWNDWDRQDRMLQRFIAG